MDQDFIGAKGAIFIGRQLLITLRDDKAGIPWPNMWDLPGGGREGSEDGLQTLIRETQEEVGLDLTPYPPVWSRRYPSAAEAGKFTYFFAHHLPAGHEAQIVFGDEGQGWRLISLPEYRTLPACVPFLRERVFDYLAASGWDGAKL